MAFLSLLLLLVGAAMASAAAGRYAPTADPVVSATIQQIDVANFSPDGLPGRDRLIYSADNGLIDTEAQTGTDCIGSVGDAPVAAFAETFDADLRRFTLCDSGPAWPAWADYKGPVTAVSSLLLRIHARPPPLRLTGASRIDRA